MKNLLSLILLYAMFIITASGQSKTVDGLAAVVNDEVITLSMLEDEMNAVWDDTQKQSMPLQEAFENLINRKLELQEARRLGVIVSEESLAREVARLMSRFVSPKDFSEVLQRSGITQKDLEEYLLEKAMVQEMIDRKFRLFVEVSETDASDFFERHREEFIIPESVHLNQIFLQLNPDSDEATKKSVKRRAEEIFRELKNNKYIEERPGSDYVVSDSGYVTTDGLPIPIVAAAVSRLEIGESELIETPAGYFILRLNDRRPARQASFDEVKEKIKERLIQEKTEAEHKAWLVKQRDTADIRIKLKLGVSHL